MEAVKWGMQIATSLGITCLIVGSDCRSLVYVLQMDHDADINQELKDLLQDIFLLKKSIFCVSPETICSRISLVSQYQQSKLSKYCIQKDLYPSQGL